MRVDIYLRFGTSWMLLHDVEVAPQA